HIYGTTSCAMPSARWERPLLRLELESGAVHAVAEAGRRRAIRKYVPEMAAALVAVHFGPRHAVGVVHAFADRLVERTLKTRPARAAVVLRIRLEQRLSAASAREEALAFFLVERARAARFGPVLT